MNLSERKRALNCAKRAAIAAGKLMLKNFRLPKKINEQSRHDIKLELDVHCQKLIEITLHKSFPDVAFIGEEGCSGDEGAKYRWVVDPIDGTVNFTYEIPHSCVSIALQKKVAYAKSKTQSRDAAYETLVGVVHDPFCRETWTAIRGQAAFLNGKEIRTSQRARLEEAIVSIGFGKSETSVGATLVYFPKLMGRVRKVRIMGAAALGMVYVASGRFDAYVEGNIRLWDIAAGGLILECAGGEFWHQAIAGENAYRMIANNGLLRCSLERIGKIWS